MYIALNHTAFKGWWYILYYTMYVSTGYVSLLTYYLLGTSRLLRFSVKYENSLKIIINKPYCKFRAKEIKMAL